MLETDTPKIKNKFYTYQNIKDKIITHALKTLIPEVIKGLTADTKTQAVDKVEVLFYNGYFHVGQEGHLVVLDWGLEPDIWLRKMIANPHISVTDSKATKIAKAKTLLLDYFNTFSEYDTIIYVTKIDTETYKNMVDNWLICNYLSLLNLMSRQMLLSNIYQIMLLPNTCYTILKNLLKQYLKLIFSK